MTYNGTGRSQDIVLSHSTDQGQTFGSAGVVANLTCNLAAADALFMDLARDGHEARSRKAEHEPGIELMLCELPR